MAAWSLYKQFLRHNIKPSLVQVRINPTFFLSKRYRASDTDSSLPRNFVVVLPELIKDSPEDNEALKLPKVGEPEIDFSELNLQNLYRGLSKNIIEFQNFVNDLEIDDVDLSKPVDEYIENLEKYLYPMDTSHYLITIAHLVHGYRDYQEMDDLLRYYQETRALRLQNNMKLYYQHYIKQESLNPGQKHLLSRYKLDLPDKANYSNVNLFGYYRTSANFHRYLQGYKKFVDKSNEKFSYTIDDPDILASISPDIFSSLNLHHRERAPLRVTVETYERFMQLCPDRFVRRNLWLDYSKRASPESSARDYNNTMMISSIRELGRSVAEHSGYRNYIDRRLQTCLAESTDQIVESLSSLNRKNLPLLHGRIKELSDFADNNNFEDSSKIGIQDYDVDYWSHKYKYDVLIGLSESTVRAFFPLDAVMTGLSKFSEDYLGIEVNALPYQAGKYWSESVKELRLSRNGKCIGTILLDPYASEGNKQVYLHGSIRERSDLYGCNPSRLMRTPFIKTNDVDTALLSFEEIYKFFQIFGASLHSFLNDFGTYELNLIGGLETDINKFLGDLCTGYLLKDHRILQSCSKKDGNGTIDAELATKIIGGYCYTSPFKLWRNLYKAHLDQQAHVNMKDIKKHVTSIYPIYSPFPRNPMDYDYCSMPEVFSAENAGMYYSMFWSNQVANHLLEGLMNQQNSKKANLLLSSLPTENIRDYNSKILDVMFDKENFNTMDKLKLLAGREFKPTEARLCVF